MTAWTQIRFIKHGTHPLSVHVPSQLGLWNEPHTRISTVGDLSVNWRYWSQYSYGTWTCHRFTDPRSHRTSNGQNQSQVILTWNLVQLQIHRSKFILKIRLMVLQSIPTWNMNQLLIHRSIQVDTENLTEATAVLTHMELVQSGTYGRWISTTHLFCCTNTQTARNWPLCKDTHCAVTSKKERVQSRHAVPQAHFDWYYFKVLLVPCELSLTFQTHCMSVRCLGHILDTLSVNKSDLVSVPPLSEELHANWFCDTSQWHFGQNMGDPYSGGTTGTH